MKTILIPSCKLSANNNISAAERRKKLRDSLLQGRPLVVTPNEGIKEKGEQNTNEPAIEVPKGKLASFYWYEKDSNLFQAEQEAMKRNFSQFSLEKLDDGRMSWNGYLHNLTGEGSTWYLQAIYENNHPDNSSYGGSIKIYPIKPSLEDICEELDEAPPHLLRDPDGYLYLCTSRPEDFKARHMVTTAASSLAWAAKWIVTFELWLAGDISTREFEAHKI